MKSSWNPTEARAALERDGQLGEDLALRVYSSRLLGSEPSLVLHGGGNTSVKSQASELTGERARVLYVKGSGWDLATIEPAGFPACRLGPLEALCRLEELSDEDMVRALQSQMLDPKSPTPSVEALLHAFVPAKFVDHTHADAVLTLVDQPDSRARVEELYEGRALFVPYVMPGFALARAIVELGADFDRAGLMILDKHGIFTWGSSAEESYERMIAAVDRAEQAVRRGVTRAVVVPGRLSDDERRRRQAELSPLLRGALGTAADGKRLCIEWRDEPDVLALLERDDAEALTARGTVTPDHVIRIKPFPLFLAALRDGELLPEPARARSAINEGLRAFAARYEQYFERGRAALGRDLTRLDRLPRVVHVPGLGAACLGSTLRDARVASDLVLHSARVLHDAESLGRFEPVGALDLFEVEYWSLEQAKLAVGKARGGALTGRIALVTGAASGIGRAAAEAFLSAGAHVTLSDRDGVRLAECGSALSRFGPAVHAVTADVTSDADVERLLCETTRHFGGLDLVVSNAGTAPSGQLHEPAGDLALRQSLDINLLSHQRVASLASRTLIAQGLGGCLLFNASKSAFNPGPDFGPYAVPKAALVALMRQYAVDLGKYGIRSSAINADRIRTKLFGGGVLESRARARGVSPDEYFAQNLLGRETTAKDVAAALLFLATAEATTGAVITVDGGNAAAFVR